MVGAVVAATAGAVVAVEVLVALAAADAAVRLPQKTKTLTSCADLWPLIA